MECKRELTYILRERTQIQKFMKKIIKLTAMALCTLALCLTSCSKDDNNENIGGKEKELTKEQFLEAQTKVLNSIPGDYKVYQC